LFSVYSDFQEENAKLRRENAELESALNEKGAVASLAGSKLAAVEAHSKIALAEAQVQLYALCTSVLKASCILSVTATWHCGSGTELHSGKQRRIRRLPCTYDERPKKLHSYAK
jgi:hypothetical protein